MLYAILAYHEEGVVESWTKEEDTALMAQLLQANDRLIREKCLGPAARLAPTRRAVTLREKGDGMITDGPFAETKEQLLGFYIVDCPRREAAIAAARDLRMSIRPRLMRSDPFRFIALVPCWKSRTSAETALGHAALTSAYDKSLISINRSLVLRPPKRSRLTPSARISKTSPTH